MKFLMTMTALLVVGSVASVATAVAAGNPPAVALQYTQADLDNPAQVARLHARMVVAAAQVCERYSGRELARQRGFRLCADRALAAGVDQVRSPALSAYHLRRIGAPRNAAAAVASLADATAR